MGPDLLLGRGHPFEEQSDQGQNKRRELMGVNAPVLPEYALSPLLDLCYAFHSLDCGLDQVAVVAYWDVSSFLEIDGRVLPRREEGGGVLNKTEILERPVGRTMIISFPAALRKALVHRTFRGLRFILLITEQASGIATGPRREEFT